MSGVLVVLEYRNGAEGQMWARMSWEAIAAAGQLAQICGGNIYTAALGGTQLGALAAEAAGHGGARLHTLEHALLAKYTPEGYTLALEELIRRHQPEWVVFPHTYRTRDLAPRLATRFHQVLIADIIAMRDENGSPVFVRQLMQGKLNADYRKTGNGPGFISVQAGAFRAEESPAAPATVEPFTVTLDSTHIRTQPGEPFRESAQTVDLGSAAIIVSIGRGIKEQENIPIVRKLADALGAELAASRPICDNGWLPMERQVGSSGQTVAPKLYLAIGISGAIQHLVGMKGSKSIVAINKDENAPIFEAADYGIVGDLFEIVPALTEAVNKARSS